MKRTFILNFLLAISCFSFAQKNYSEGYIITLKNDTIHGKVRDNLTVILGKTKISFIDDNGKEDKYSAKEILGYSKADIANYLSIDVGFNKDFARIIVDGDVFLLSYKSTRTSTMPDPKGKNFMVNSTTQIEELYLYNRNTKKLTFVKEFNFHKSMAEYFSDYTDLKNMILNKELRYSDMEIIVQKYNNWKKKNKSNS